MTQPRRFIRAALACAALIVLSAAGASAQVTITIARVAFKDVATQRFAEVLHESRSGWIFPDIGYVDFGGDVYREFFAGAGRTLRRTPKLTLVGSLYYQQSAGPASGSARYLVPWFLVNCRPHARLQCEAVYFPYLPLTERAQVQHVLERAKLEYSVLPELRVGGGYAAFHTRGIDWQNLPFATVTVSPPRIGDIEVWVQHLPGRGAQMQLRFMRVFK
ncbi:MAG TPA: hypothetical protein VFK57_07075 [Vicinamibacterales bacterium]|nr:hypothetical protein [Vicinamibacterales bacterium]